jgi:glycosidase
MTLAENYPPQVLHCCMTLLGTHDTARILTALMGDSPDSREEAARSRLSPEQYVHARQLLMAAAFLQYTLPGAPSLYYGDEAGMEGHKDPFNRRPFPWGREDTLLQAHFRRLGQLRRNCEPLRRGDIRFFRSEGGRLGFTRSLEGKTLRICMNRSGESWPLPGGKLLFGCGIETAAEDGITLAPMGFCICEEIEAWKTNNFSPATAGF